MNVLPSTSVRREPDARAMNSGDAPTDLNARTGLSTPPGMSFWARSKRLRDFAVRMGMKIFGNESGLWRLFITTPRRARSKNLVMVSCSSWPRDEQTWNDELRDGPGGFPGVVRNDDVRAGAADRGQRLEHRASLVNPAVARGSFDHRVFAADLVGSRRVPEPLLHPRQDVEIRQRGLHHHDVRALFDVLLHFAQRLVSVRRIHLVRLPVAKLRRRIRRLTERPVKHRPVFRGICHDRRVLEAALVERLPDRADASVHHVRGRYDV